MGIIGAYAYAYAMPCFKKCYQEVIGLLDKYAVIGGYNLKATEQQFLMFWLWQFLAVIAQNSQADDAECQFHEK